MADREPNSCPTAESLRRFMLGEVEDQRLLQISEHLEFCTQCIDRLGLSEFGSPIAMKAESDFHETLSESDVALLSQELWTTEMPKRLGKYPVKRQLAVGGMGVVYEAWHPSLMCDVVIKTIKPGRAMRIDARRRMLEEQQVMGRIRHPSIVAVLDADTDNDQPFIVMEKVAGVTLAQWVLEESQRQSEMQNAATISSGVPWRDACRVGQAISEGLHQLHQVGLIHRDVKPSNVMIDKGESVKLLDLGLALHVGKSGAATTPESAGTPCFASPEQAAKREIDFRSDLYGLAATIVFLLTGAAPSRREIAKDIAGEPIPEELRDLLAELLEEDPARRPQSANAVSNRLASIQPKSRFTWWLESRSARAAFAGIGLLTLVIAAVDWRPGNRSEPKEAVSGSKIFSHETLNELGPLPLGSSTSLDTFLPRSSVVNAKLSSSGRYLACFGHGGNLRIYNVDEKAPELIQLVRCFRSTNVNHPQINWMDNDRAIAVTGADYDPMLIWDVQEKYFRCEIGTGMGILASQVNGNGDRLASVDGSGRITVHDSRGQLVTEATLPDSLTPTTVAWSMDSTELLVGTKSTQLMVFDAMLDNERLIENMPISVSAVGLKGAEWAVGDPNGMVHHFDGDFDLLGTHAFGDKPIDALARDTLSNGVYVLSEKVERLDLSTGHHLALAFDRISRHPLFIQSWKGNIIIAGGNVWKFSTVEKTRDSMILRGAGRQITSVEINDRKEQITICTTNSVLIVNTDGEVLSKYAFGSHSVYESKWSPDGQWLAAVSGWGGKHLYVWSSNQSKDGGLKLRHEIEASKFVVGLAWLDNRRVITAGEAGIARVWDVKSGAVESEHPVGDFVRSIAVSPDRQRVAFGFQHNGCTVVDHQFSPVVESRIASNGSAIRGLRWHPENNQLAVLNEDRRVRVIDVDSKDATAELHSPWSKPTSIRWNPSGKSLAISPLGIYIDGPDRQLIRQQSLPRSGGVSWTKDGNCRAVIDQLSALHFYREDQHEWTILLDQLDSAITVDAKGQRLSSWGSPTQLIR